MFAIRVEHDTLEALRARAAREGRTVSDLAREALAAATDPEVRRAS